MCIELRCGQIQRLALRSKQAFSDQIATLFPTDVPTRLACCSSVTSVPNA
ncbi:MAG UNVERIFIED_CONTAM: hypothetical protein LVT10_20350 [Anaerolineae bacterium]